jgi:acyl-CoA thioester hydrolase
MAMKSVAVYRRFSDLDPLGHVNNVIYLDYLQEARVGLIEDVSLVFGRGYSQIVVDHNLRYVKPLGYAREPLRIDLWVSRLGRSSYDINYVIHDENGVVAATAVTKLAVIDAESGRPIRIPQEVLDQLGDYVVERGADNA